MHVKCYVYGIPGVSNMRDLGGYTANDGRITGMGRFIRSTALDRIGREGEEELLDLGVDCIIDLRSSMERLKSPDVIEKSKNIHFLHVPMLDYIQSSFASGDFSTFPASMFEMYAGLLDKSQDEIRTVFRLFSDDRFNCCLFHCTAGKDRTGLMAMLLLGLAGVDDETIIEDYSYTEVIMGIDQISQYPGLPGYLFRSEPQSMRDTLGHIREKYGGVRKYLTRIGIDRDSQEKIINKLFK